MNKNLIIGAVLVAILVIWGGYSASSKKTASDDVATVSSAITVAEDKYDFGDIDIFGGKVETSYTLQNTGTEDILITSAFTSCMCTEGKIDDLIFGMHGQSGGVVVISAGEEKILTAIFDPLAHGPEGTGPITRELFLTTNSTITPEVVARFSGNVIKN